MASPSDTPQSDLTGVILAGGRSSRLGRDKPMVQVGGQLMLARVAHTLRDLCRELILVVRPGQSDHVPDTGIALRMHVVADRYRDAGPMAGIEAGLAACVTDFAFVTGADYPFLSSKLIRAMAAHAAEHRVAVIPRFEDRFQSLTAIYPRHWQARLRTAIEANQTSMLRFIADAVDSGDPPVKVFEESEARIHDRRLNTFLDIDTPSQLAEAQRRLRRGPYSS